MRCPICGSCCKPQMIEKDLQIVYLPRCEVEDCSLTGSIETVFQTKKDARSAWEWVAKEVATYTSTTL